MSDKTKIQLNSLSVGYGKTIIVDGISFSVKAGKIVTLIGPNGCGKSTILKSVTKQIETLGGTVAICGKDISGLTGEEIAKSVSMVMTEHIRPEHMTCREIVETGRYPYTGRFGFLTKEDTDKVEYALNITDSMDLADKDFCRISDGQRQRIMLARAICQDTDVIVLDEPTTYLDMYYKLELMKIIKRLAALEEKAIIISLHELDLVRMISDTVVCINNSGVVNIGSTEEIFCNDYIQKLYGIRKDEFDPKTGQVFLRNEGTEAERDRGTNNVCSNDEAYESTVNNINGRNSTKVLMVQGTMSGVGKSLVVAGLLRVLKQDGYTVAPFKSQNMALNSFVTRDGHEMGRAQVMQAEAAGMEPDVCMNPILLKPTNNTGSQVIVNGKVYGDMGAREYFSRKTDFIPDIMNAFNKLSEKADIIVMEGAGSPAEINLKNNDIVNMGMARMVDAPVVLVGDIDRGGVFAQLLGTINLLEEDEKRRVKGLIVNKFRGDKTILDPGIDMLTQRAGIPVVGVLPFMDISLEDEDSLTDKFLRTEKGIIDIAVIRLPRISNYTDFDTFEQVEGVSLRYVSRISEMGSPDMVILPGSKNTISDMKWLRENGFENIIKKASDEGVIIFGICGGYQMLGKTIDDPSEVEEGGKIEGLGLLDIATVMTGSKNTSQYEGSICSLDGSLESLSDMNVTGYEIHMGKTEPTGINVREFTSGGTGYYKDNIFGTYIHGFFDNKEILMQVIKVLSDKKGVSVDLGNVLDFADFKEREYDRLADMIREYMDMEAIYSIIENK